MSGWIRDPQTRLWHYFPPRWYGFSICFQEKIDGRPLEKKPSGILVCAECLKEMRRLSKAIDRGTVQA